MALDLPAAACGAASRAVDRIRLHFRLGLHVLGLVSAARRAQVARRPRCDSRNDPGRAPLFLRDPPSGGYKASAPMAWSLRLRRAAAVSLVATAGCAGAGEYVWYQQLPPETTLANN